MCLPFKSIENTGKGEVARNEQFLLFQLFSIHLGEFSDIFIKFEIVVCTVFQYAWDYLKLNVLERDKKGVPYIALTKYEISDNCHLI